MANKMTYELKDQVLTVKTEAGTRKLTVLTPSIVRVQDGDKPSAHGYAIEGDKQQKVAVEAAAEADQVAIKTSRLRVTVSRAGFVDLYTADGQLLVADYRGQRVGTPEQLSEDQLAFIQEEGHDVSETQHQAAVTVIKQLPVNEHFYGLGDKTGFIDKREYVYDNWNTDDPAPQMENFTRLYKSIPILYGLNEGRAYGLFFDNPNPSHFDLGRENAKYFYYTTNDGALDYYLIAGPKLADVVTRYTSLTGRVPLPQKWTLGYQQSRWSYASEEEVLDVAKHMQDAKLPCDVIHLDIDYMDGYRVFTTNPKTFPHFRELIAKLAKQGIKAVAIIDPGVKKDPGYSVYEDGLKRDAYVKTPEGDVYVNRVWPGDAVFPDFGKKSVRQWWGSNQKFLIDRGVAGTWNDMNEPASFNGPIPQNIVFSDEDQPSTHHTMHNVYAHNMAKATYNCLKKFSGKRPFVITRAAFAGTQKYSTVWTGDNRSLWAHLQMAIPQLCNLGMSGFSFAGTDVGGFGSDVTPELLVRWIEGALFSPLLRNHSAIGTRRQEPWVFGDKNLAIYRKYLQLRYHLIDYLYDLFYQESKNGLPIMRPLVLAYPDDPHVANLNDEYLVGENLLVAPVTTPGTTQRMVYLPAGEWVDFWSGETKAGGQSIIVDAPLDYLPLFVKRNSLLPWRPSTSHVDVASETKLSFKLYGFSGTYTHYQDNGTDFAYENGEYNLYQVTVGSKVSVILKHAGYAHPYQQIKVAGRRREHTFNFDAQTKAYVEADDPA